MILDTLVNDDDVNKEDDDDNDGDDYLLKTYTDWFISHFLGSVVCTDMSYLSKTSDPFLNMEAIN